MKPILMATLFILACSQSTANQATHDFQISSAKVTYLDELDLLVFEQQVEGVAGRTVPEKIGQMDGAIVQGYVFPTTLAPTDVGFGDVEGIVALAVTAHPDFDDTPLWDENNDQNYANDGVVYHSHWVVLNNDNRVPGGLSVKQFDASANAILPPTNPGMPMYMDSPGYSIVLQDNTLKVLVPAQRIGHKKSFNFDAVSVLMKVSKHPDKPLLGVYEVYKILSSDLSLPYTVTH